MSVILTARLISYKLVGSFKAFIFSPLWPSRMEILSCSVVSNGTAKAASLKRTSQRFVETHPSCSREKY
ncbi:hypothetical protein OIU79_026742 [Salix purpurea]|uniref:Uncharacterized protein n=1 Tax=Salix purpurea TaxID=77065 RepID=A0A9Q0VS26_SALPP|nr:hypothetical protein OIU79_026742 [Salix purpurea]